MSEPRSFSWRNPDILVPACLLFTAVADRIEWRRNKKEKQNVQIYRVLGLEANLTEENPWNSRVLLK
jgi:hypothetical protein